MKLNKEKKEMILGIIAVRLDNVKDVTRRSRLAFLITTIASSAIFITIWSVYFSTARDVALYTTTEIRENEKEIQKKKESTPSAEQIRPQVSPILPLPEYNRRELIKEWIKNLNVSIDLLGIEVNINDFPFIVSLGLFVVCFWLFFTFRRENRAIVSLLRDVRNDLEFPQGNQKKGDDVWDIANLAFHGVANSLIFFTTGTNDRPLSHTDIFGGTQSGFQAFLDNFIGQLTKIIRKLVMILIFFPALTIGFIIWADEYSTNHVPSPFRTYEGRNITPAENMKINGMEDSLKQITFENSIGGISGVLTLLICIACFTFQSRTSKALREFEKALNGELKIKIPDSENIETANGSENKPDDSAVTELNRNAS